MRKKLSQKTSERRHSLMRGLLLMALLCLVHVGTAFADTKNAGSYFKITHNPTPTEPYIDFEYISDDFNGINDILASSTFYIGWSGVEYKILSYGRCVNNEQKHNTKYGATEQLNGYKTNDRYIRRRRFYPSAELGCGPGSALSKGFYIRMNGRWDIDDNESNGDYTIEEKRYPDNSKYTALISTPSVTIERYSRTKIKATTSSLVYQTGWSGGICFTTKKSTKTTDIYYYNEIGNGHNGSDGKMNSILNCTTDETKDVSIYYHRYLDRTITVDGVSVRQLLDGELKTATLPKIGAPSNLKASYHKYNQETTLTWTNPTSGYHDGYNVVYRKTVGGSWSKLGSVNANVATYTDAKAYVGNNYIYAVMFVPKTYATPSAPDELSPLTTMLGSSVGEAKKFTVDLTITGNDDATGLILTWKPETSAYELDYTLYRYDDTSKEWKQLYSGQNTTYEDKDNLVYYKTYQYKVTTTFWDTEWAGKQSITNQSVSKVTEVSATRGIYANSVKVKWNALQRGDTETRYVVSRRPLNDEEAPYMDVHEVNGTTSTYIFEDNNAQTGMYYMYRVTPYAMIPDDAKKADPTLGDWGVGTPMESDGFSMAKGVITGRVTYGSGMPVEGVKVCADKVVSDNEQEQYYSLASNSKDGAFSWTPSDYVKDTYLQSKPFTIQMWAMPNPSNSNQSTNRCILSIPGQLSLFLSNMEENESALAVTVRMPGQEDLQQTGLSVPTGQFSNISISNDQAGNYNFYVVSELDVDSVSLSGTDIDWSAGGASLLFAGNGVEDEVFDGFVDDIRVWSRVMSRNDLYQYHNRILAGAEQGLVCYWPLDEGVKGLPYTYDNSKKNGVPNGNHANVMTDTRPVEMVPTSDQLSLYGETNSEGGYEIRGIPFAGDGTNYIVQPTMGIHEFNAKYMTRFVSSSSLVHNSVDFEDVTSFPVDGYVYYENTTIPVEDAYIYIDGVMQSKDGEPVMTDADGHYTVTVPIGDHFIQVKKSGHTFVNNGRYPEDPKNVGLKFTFEESITGLTFWDDTKVMVAGRVAGGAIEEGKPLGLQQGTANIGRATLTLNFPRSDMRYINAAKEIEGTAVNYVPSSEMRKFEAEGGKAYVIGGENAITIETDSVTGEFAVLLPPLYYETEGITVWNRPSTDVIDFSGNHPVLDATNPEAVYTDSIETENGMKYFDYVASAKVIHRSAAKMEVSENEDGSFGMESIAIKDINENVHNVTLYTINENGDVEYPFGAPVYQMLDRYTFNLYAYENYTSYDVAEGEDPVTVQVPIPYSNVTVKNQFASTTTVAEADGAVGEVSDEDFTLDENGRAEYTFICGLPNIQAPYTRTLAISYEVNGEVMSWDGNDDFKAVVLGVMSTGTNFVTQGPDRVSMVLRDPPGSLSKTTYSSGTEVTSVKTYNKTSANASGVQTDVFAGCEMQTGGGFGFIALSELSVENTLSIGAESTDTWNSMSQKTSVTTLTKEISTSDGTDFVGAGGDLFIGTSNNYVFGTCRNVCIKIVDGQYTLRCAEAVSMGEQFNTDFNFTQNYVENVLIPKYEDLRNKLFTTETHDPSGVSAPSGDNPIYVSLLEENDERFGSDNDDVDVWGENAKDFVIANGRYEGPSYVMILPEGFSGANTSKNNRKTGVQDMVKYYNEQIRMWQNQLKLNEEQKVKAMNDRSKYLDKNYSFDAGAVLTSTLESSSTNTKVEETTSEVNVILSNETGLSVCGVGFGLSISSSTQNTVTNSSESSTTTTTSTSFTLQEDGDDDYLSVDVFKAPDGFGPIFVTRAGATSAPYEDEVVTKYYEPGTVISQKTQQIEKPEIEILDAIVTGVPGGEEAKFRVALRNNSDTQEDCYFGLRVEANSNSDGAQVYVDGQNLGVNPILLIPYGETIKTFSLKQSDLDVLDYENIEITMYSTSQPDDTGVFPGIYSTGTVSVHFQPACSNIMLATNKTVVNTDTKNSVVLSMSGYDYSMTSFRDIRLQYKGIHDTDFRTLQEYTKDADRLANDKDLQELIPLTGTTKLNFALDMTDSRFTDQTYVFRAVAVCIKGSGEVTRSSEEVEIIRDLSLPQLLSTPTPQSGVLYPGDDISITFNEPIRNDLLAKVNNFKVVGVKNEGEVAHSVGLKINDQTQASTESSINLEDRSFALGLWLKYSADGTLLQHGTKDNGMTVSITDGKLAVDINGNTVTSEEALPKDKWLYLMLSLDQDSDDARLDARYAEDTQTTDLFYSYIGAYNGNGKLAIGGNALTGAMQELTLWNKALSLDELQGSMHQVKNNCTDGLAGYWRFDEGHGSVAADIVRNRHITLDSESAWWKNFTNYALTSGGKLDVSALGFNDNDDFVMETWMNADQQQSEGDVYVIANKPSKLALRMDGDRRLQFDYSGKTAQVTDEAVNDNQWHHVAVAVNHSSNGYAKIYVDGKLRTQVPAQEVYAPRGESLYLASYEDGETTSRMQGCIDEVRIWKGQRSATVINDWMYRRANGEEDMLALHLPFETITINEYNQAVTVPSYANTIDKKELSQTGSETLAATADKAPALNEAETLENINYSFVANENQITFQIEEQPAAVEGRTLTFTARNIQDLNGNSNSPVTWNVLVKQSNLKWTEETIDEVLPYGETASFSTEISNTGISTENWVLSGVPSWLDVSSESGSLPALKNMTLKFTPQEGMAIGKYEATVMLTGSQGIEQPLYISLYVKGEAPDWAATPDETNMNVIGQLKVDGIISSDPDDMLAAFRNGKCVGVAQPKYLSKYDTYLVMMDVYGNQEEHDNDLEYKMYDASTGTVYPLVSASDSKACTFVADTWVGSFESPVTFTPENKIEQTIACGYEGWKWFSLFAKPESMDISSVFTHSNDAISVIKDEKCSSYPDNGVWTGTLTSLSLSGMYKVKTKAAFSEAYLGTPAEDEAASITLANGWSWLGYPVSVANSLGNALAGADPQEGDMIKGQSGFAIYTDNQWIGSLGMMTPGLGYQYYSNGATEKSFTFPKVKPAKAKAMARALKQESLELDYENNMTLIAVVTNDGMSVDNATVSVYADGRLCGRSTAPVVDGKFFITIGGNAKSRLTFVVETPQGSVQLAQSMTFEADSHFGSMDNPFVLEMDKATSISQFAGDMQDVALLEVIDNGGRIIKSVSNPTESDFPNKADIHASGIFNVRLTYRSGETKVVRIVL